MINQSRREKVVAFVAERNALGVSPSVSEIAQGLGLTVKEAVRYRDALVRSGKLLHEMNERGVRVPGYARGAGGRCLSARASLGGFRLLSRDEMSAVERLILTALECSPERVAS